MKNILSLILAAVLLLLCTVPTFALDITESGDTNIDISHTIGNALSGDGEVDADVSHTVQGGYIMTIPASVSFAKDNYTSTYELGVGNVRVPGTLHISISSLNYDAEKGWVLTSARGDTLKYTIKVNDADVANGGDLLSCAHGTTYLTQNVSFTLEETDAKTVSYTDTLTFTVSVQ